MWNPYIHLSTRAKNVFGIVSFVIVLALWSAVSFSVVPAKLPSPWAVGKAFLYLAQGPPDGESLLWPATLKSVSRIILAGMLVVPSGILIGVLMGVSRRINACLSPLVDPFRSAPIVAVLPILVMWLGIGESMKIAFLWLGAVVYLVPMVRDAIQAVPPLYYTKAKDLGATDVEAVRHALVPMAMPRIADAVIVSVSIMWTYITVAEFVNAKVGLGQMIQNSKRFAAMDQVFAGIFVIIGLALVTFQSMRAVKNWLFPWAAES